MDANTTALLLQAAPLLIAPLAAGLAKGLEKLPAFPYTGGSKAGIVATLLVVALLCRVALAWATGTLATLNLEVEIRLLYDALVGAGLAAGGYAIARADKPALPG